jgi:hypothetical protein
MGLVTVLGAADYGGIACGVSILATAYGGQRSIAVTLRAEDEAAE